MVSTFFAVGVIVGLSYLLLSDIKSRQHDSKLPQHSAPHDSGASPVNTEDLDIPTQSAGKDRVSGRLASFDTGNRTADGGVLEQQGDSYLKIQNFSQAVRRYQQAEQALGRTTNELLLKFALCEEFNSNFKAASEYYRRVLENRPAPIHRWVAMSGMSRTWMGRNNANEALVLLYELYLESARQDEMPNSLRAQINYQLGQALQEIVLAKYHFDPRKSDGVVFHTARPSVDELLELVNLPLETEAANSRRLRRRMGNPVEEQAAGKQAEEEESVEIADRISDAPDHPQISVVQRTSDSLDMITVDVDSPLVPVTELLKQLVVACEGDLLASHEAQALIAARSKSIRARNTSVGIILDSILIPLGVIWFQDEQGIHLQSLAESSELAQHYFPLAMERVYRRFLLRFPGDHRVTAALMSQAGLRFIEGDLDRASNYYQELLRQNPKEEILAKAFFNLGKVEMRLGRNESAIKYFYSAIDQSQLHELQSTAYWLVGQLYLEANQISESIKAAGRSLSLTRLDDQRRLAALTLSRGYIISNQPLSANRVLYDHRLVFEGSSLESTAAMIASLARYLGMTDKHNLNTESNRLLTTVAAISDHQFENFLDIYIASKAWLELGFRDKTIEMLTLAADSTTLTAWRRQFLFELAVQLYFSGETDRASSVFEFLAEIEEPDTWSRRSLLQLAEIYIDMRRAEECINVCEQLFAQEMVEGDKQRALQCMGRAYRQLGQHHSAAICFAGMIPVTKKETGLR